jgi:S-DNA-T family DNA segregation ATPase FtsK/SpoIIIE
VAPAISTTRQRQILALLLAACSVLTLASIATYRAPLPFAAPWSAPNACGPVGGTLAFFLVWALGRMAAFGVPVLAAAWFWNRLHDRPIGPLLLKSTLAALLVFEVCTLLGLGGLARADWSGGWGLAASLALRSALGGVGSWIVAGALFGVTVLAASELGFRWLGPLVRGALFTPFARLASAWQEWRERSGEEEEVASPRAAKSAEKPAAARAEKPERKPKVVRAAEALAVAGPVAAAVEAEARSKPRITAPGGFGVGGEDEDRDQLSLPNMPERRPPAKLKPRPAPAAARANGHPVPAPPIGPVPTEAFPALALLGLPAQQEDLMSAADLNAEAELLVSKLKDFGIEGRVTEIHPGPVVTTF